LHPTQVYSSLFSLGIFLLLYFVAQHRLKKSGQLLFLYLMLVGIERSVIDFFRGDREFFAYPGLQALSVYQWIALAIFFLAFFGFVVVSRKNKK